MKISRFEDFEIWKLSIKITRDVYDLTAKRDFSKDYGLRNQLRRAIISTSSNIVEGFEKNNNNEFIRFLKIAKGSVGEARNQIYIALTVGYISKEEFFKVNKELENLAQQIGGFIVYLERKRKDKEFTKK
jgi:four helix bundle protein